MSDLKLKPIEYPGLLLGPEDFVSIKRKIETCGWARSAFDRLLADADVDADVVIPDRKGQWMHYYACSDDGTSLQTVTDTEHRCPTCGRIYTGEPYDSVVIRNRHMKNGERAVALGLAGHLTGDARYLDKAKEMVLGYADRYLSFEWRDNQGNANRGGRVFCTHLNESNWLITASWAYDLVAAGLSEAERRKVCADFLLQGANIVLAPKRNIHNIMCWRNSGAGLAALCAGDQDIVHTAVDSETGLHQQIAQGILDDGMWWECSWGYHFYTMSAIWPLVEAVRRQDVDVYDDRYKGLFDAPIRFAFPNGELPPLNDSGSGGKLPARCEPFEIAYARWGDPEHAAVLAQMDRSHRLALCFGEPRPSGVEDQKPGDHRRTTANFSSAGVAILRGRETDTNVTLDYGPHGGGHGHPDKLGIILFAKDRTMAPDPGSIPYAIPLHREWFKQTISHNTVLVDGISQEPCTGELVRLDAESDLQIASAVAHDAYPGLRYGRTVALAPGGVILDVFRIEGDGIHTFDWVFHCKGALTTNLAASPTDCLGANHGYQHVENPQGATVDGPWSLTWTDNDAGVVLAMAGHGSTQVITGVGRGNPPSEKLPLVIARRSGASATFVAAYVVHAGSPEPVSLTSTQTDDTVSCELTRDGQTHTYSLPLPYATGTVKQ